MRITKYWSTGRTEVVGLQRGVVLITPLCGYRFLRDVMDKEGEQEWYICSQRII